MNNEEILIQIGKVSEEFSCAFRKGESPSVDKWVARYPDLPAEELRRQLEITVVLIEAAQEPLPTRPLSPEADKRIKNNLLTAYDKMTSAPKKSEAELYHKEGLALFKQGNFPAAEEQFRRVVVLVEAPQPYYKLGEIALKRGDDQTAEEMFRKSLKLCGPDDAVGLILNCQHLGEIYAKQGMYQTAETMFQQIISLGEVIPDRKWTAYIYEKLSESQFYQQNHQSAQENVRTALTIYKELDDQAAQVRVGFNLGSMLKATRDYEGAIAAFQKVLDLTRETGNEPITGRTLALLGEIFSCRNEQKTATDFYRQAIPLLEKAKDTYLLGNTYYNLGETEANALDYRQAEDNYRKALALARETKNLSLEGIVYGALGHIFAQQDDFWKAAEYSRKATDIYQTLSGQKPKDREMKQTVREVLTELLREQTPKIPMVYPAPTGRGLGRLDWEALKINRNIGAN